MTDEPIDYDAIRQTLKERQRSSAFRFVDPKANQYDLYPCLTEAEITAFEQSHRITLPDDYRGFLLQVGNGGAGPDGGFFKLGQMDNAHKFARWRENDGFVGMLSEPFPHTDAWNDLSGKLPFDESRELDQEYEDAYMETVSAWQEAFYWNSMQVNGAIPICHRGCAQRLWLVITGSERGHIWCDYRADEGGIFPLQHASRDRVTFIQWYLDWLNPWN